MVYLLRRLELRDFLSHEHTEIEFGEGITAIIGENGAGKSSIVDAIYYALLLPYKKNEIVRGEKANLVRKGSKTGKARIRLLLEDPDTGEKLEVNTIISKGKSSKSEVSVRRITRDGKPILLAGEVRKARRVIAEALGIDPDTYERVLSKAILLRQYSLQGLVSLFTSEPRERRRFLRSIFGVESYEKAYDRLARVSVDIKGEKVSPVQGIGVQLSYRKRSLESQMQKLREEIREARDKLASERKRLEDIGKRLLDREEKLETARRELEEVLERVSHSRSVLERINRELERKIAAKNRYERLFCNEIMDGIEGVRRKLDEAASLVAEVRQLKGVVDEAKDSILVTRQRLGELERKLKIITGLKEILGDKSLEDLEKLLGEKQHSRRHVNEQLQETLRLIEKLEAMLSEWIRAVDNASRTLVRYNIKVTGQITKEIIEKILEDIEEKAEKLARKAQELNAGAKALKAKAEDNMQKTELLRKEAGLGKCPLCGHELSKHEALHLAERLSREARELEEKARRLEEEARMLDARKGRLERLSRELSRHLFELSRIEEKLIEYNDIEHVKLKLEEARREAGILERTLHGLEQEISRLSIAIGKARALASQAGLSSSDRVTEEMILNYRREIENLSLKIKELEAKLNNAKQALEEKTRLLSNILVEGKYTDLDKLLEEYERLSREAAKLQDKIIECTRLREAFSGLDELLTEKKRLRGELARLNQELSRARKLVENLENEIEELREEDKRIHGSVSGLESTIRVKEESLENARRELETIEEALYVYRILDYVRRIYKEAPEEIYRRKLRSLENIASRVISGFGLKYVSIMAKEEKDSFTFTLISKEGTSIDVEALSGGEQVIFALALVVALNILLTSRVGFLVLDEPTAHLDSERRGLIAEVLRRLREEETRGLVRQIIVVTHEEQVMGAADEIYKVSYTAGRSTVSSLHQAQVMVEVNM